MTRFTYMLLVFAPFIAYGVWLHLTERGWRAPEHWRGVPLLWLFLAGVVLTLAAFFTFAVTSGGSTKAIYVPAHMENGVFVPGRITEPDKK